jgi:predicted alpha-1,2-mannosidase
LTAWVIPAKPAHMNRCVSSSVLERAAWRTWTFVLLGCSLCTLASSVQAQLRPVEYVNTLRGSNSRPEYSRGNTFPAVSLPFGFNFWTPITEGNSSGWLYRYDRTTLQGFGVSHEPSPWVGDHGSIQLMPQVGVLHAEPERRAASFRHDGEVAQPHYYSVELESSSIRVEFTPTDHASRFRFNFPASDQSYLLFDSLDSVKGEIRVDAARRSVEGYVDHNGPRLYFVARADQPIMSVDYPQAAGASAAIRFDTRAKTTVGLSMATSFLSVQQAQTNLDDEIGVRSFDDVREDAAEKWDDTLALVQVEGASERQKITLYSNLYRAFLYPNSMWELVDGRPVHFSPYDQRRHDGKIWVNNGFWDTYRAAWPLYVLLLPEQAGEMLEGFVQAYREGGWTPRWSGPGYLDVMVGTHLDLVFADAYLKHVRDFDVKSAYDSALKNALVASDQGALGRKGNEFSIFRGYVPTSVPESAAWTLENALTDFGIGRLAHELGDGLHARYFESRALAYADLFSPDVGFFRGRKLDGSWRTSDAEFHPEEWGFEYTEGDAWQYSMAANHDPEGMARLYGGRGALSEKIDALLDAPRSFLQGSYSQVIHEMTEAYDTNMGQYAHANEPTHHILYMYNYAGTPWKTQYHVRNVLDESRGLYGPGLEDGGGYLGDEDNGQMSAWFVFSALGFYPASPGHPEYVIGSPLFTRATLSLPGGKRFVVSASANNDANRYIQRARLNGQVLTRNFLTHDEVSAGGELQLDLGPEPSTWGSGAGAVPSSLTSGSLGCGRLRDRAVGGTISASDEFADFPAANTFDDDSRSEWHASGTTPWVAYQFNESAYIVGIYTITSGADTGADPSTWTLEASDDGAQWVVLDRRVNEAFGFRRQTRVFDVPEPRSSRFYRLVIDASSTQSVRIAEFELLADEEPPETCAASTAKHDHITRDGAAIHPVAMNRSTSDCTLARRTGSPGSAHIAKFFIIFVLLGLWRAARASRTKAEQY